MSPRARVLRSAWVLGAAAAKRARGAAVGMVRSAPLVVPLATLGWWAATLVLAAAAGFGASVGLHGQPERAAEGLVSAEVPEGWRALPVVAQLRDDVVTEPQGGCSEGFNPVAHVGKLGPFTVVWTSIRYKGIAAGESGSWSVTQPDLAGSCPAPNPAEMGLQHPTTLRVDEATGLYVFEGFGGAVGACRRGKVVIARAYEPDPFLRVAAPILAALLVAGVSFSVRQSKK